MSLILKQRDDGFTTEITIDEVWRFTCRKQFDECCKFLIKQQVDYRVSYGFKLFIITLSKSKIEFMPRGKNLPEDVVRRYDKLITDTFAIVYYWKCIGVRSETMETIMQNEKRTGIPNDA